MTPERHGGGHTVSPGITEIVVVSISLLLTSNLAVQALINDGSFEKSPSSWKQSTSVAGEGCTNWIGAWSQFWPNPKHGSKYFWAGGYCGSTPNTNSASQQISVTGTELSFYYIMNRVSAESPAGDDYAYVRIDDATIWKKNMTKSNNNSGWKKATVDVSKYAGKSVTLKFGGRTGPADSLTGNTVFDYIELSGNPVVSAGRTQVGRDRQQ